MNGQNRSLRSSAGATGHSTEIVSPSTSLDVALRLMLDDHAKFTAPGAEYEEFDSTILRKIPSSMSSKLPLLLTFYLPQFHRFSENDRFWGDGFTEWHNLPRSIPRFPGHYQPRIPRNLGFYDLTMLDTLAAQVELAKSAGVGAFAFYYYRFDHGRVMERPLELFLNSSLEMPFVLIWVNESWRKRRAGTSKLICGEDFTVTLKQNYLPENEEALLQDFARHFSDRRYVRVAGRPLFVIYSPSNIPDARVAISRWRTALTSRCGSEPLMLMAQTYDDYDPRVYGLDGAIEFPPHKMWNDSSLHEVPNAYSPNYCGRACRYEEFVEFSLAAAEPDFPLVKTALPGWDNDPRYPNNGFTVYASSPKKYEDWLTVLLRKAQERPLFGTPVVAVNAWNEWAECAYLEPDIYYGSSYLNATARALVAAMS